MDIMIGKPNKPDAAKPATALWLAVADQWRRVADLERSAEIVSYA